PLRSPYVALAVLFAAVFLVFAGPFGYVIDYQGQTNDCFFLFTRSFLLEFLDHPAAPLRYAGRFLGQFYYHRWLGALVVAACVTAFGLLLSGILARREKTVTLLPVLLPCVLLAALHASPFFLVQDSLGLCAACGALLGYLRLPAGRTRRLCGLAVLPLIYLVAGAYAGLFAVWVAALEWSEGRGRSGIAFAGAVMAMVAALPLVAWRWVLPIPWSSALVSPILFGPPFRCGWPDQSAARRVADVALGVALLAVLLPIPLAGSLTWARGPARLRRIPRSRRARQGVIVSLAVLGPVLLWARYDGRLAQIVACRRLCRQGQWDELLQRAGGNVFGDHRIQFMTNFALFHRGKLLDEMFRYPQPCGTRGLLLNLSGTQVPGPGDDDSDDGMYNSDLFYEMGHVNLAMQHAFNSASLRGPSYETLVRIAQCSLANGNEPLARKYLRVLEKTLFYRDLARRYTAMLADPESLEAEFGPIRKRLPTVDGFGHPTRHFLVLLESSPDNRMALEYLVAWQLLEKTPETLQSVCADMGHLRDIGLASLPRHCQEAVLLADELTGTRVDRQGFRDDASVAARVAEFRRDMSGQGRWLDPATAQALYGDTYMFYWFFVALPADASAGAAAAVPYSTTSREE
ncbi:MAG: DUF6057 family protein, partial [Thermoguttaceae bacterium]